MEPKYFYTDGRGARTGPYTETELERLAEIGGIDWAGSVELEGLGRRWRIGEVGWLADAMMRARARRPVIDGTATPLETAAVPEAAQPPASEAGPETPRENSARATPLPPDAPAPFSAAPEAAPRTPPTMPPPASVGLPRGQAACGRPTYVLLGLLPALVGIFGVHNLVAGYTTRGVVQLVLSLAALGGPVGFMIAAPCCCVGIPVWLALVVWTIVEVATVTQDARGVTMS
jgi:hypothetical protein